MEGMPQRGLEDKASSLAPECPQDAPTPACGTLSPERHSKSVAGRFRANAAASPESEEPNKAFRTTAENPTPDLDAPTGRARTSTFAKKICSV